MGRAARVVRVGRPGARVAQGSPGGADRPVSRRHGGSETTMTCAGRPGSVGAFASVAQRQRIVREALIRPWMGPRRLAYEVGGGAIARDRWLRDNTAPPDGLGAAHGGYRLLDGGYPGQRRWASNVFRGAVAKTRRAVHVPSTLPSPPSAITSTTWQRLSTSCRRTFARDRPQSPHHDDGDDEVRR